MSDEVVLLERSLVSLARSVNAVTGWAVRDSGWRAQARCNDTEPETFFPKGRPSIESRTRCADCPVRDECLEFALNSPWEPSGIWAGLTERELRPLWRERHDTWARQHEIQDLLGIA